MTKPTVVAGNIEQLIDCISRGTLPSVRDIGRMFGVSQRSALGVLRVLAEKGILSTQARQRPKLLRSRSAVHTAPTIYSRTEALYRELVDGIQKGLFPANTPLPKLSYYSLRMRISENTVRKVYRRLMGEKIAHKTGKRVIVGTASKGHSVGASGPAPAILIVSNSARGWQSICDSDRSRGFAEVFGREAQRFGVRLLMVIGGRNTPPSEVAASAIGMEQTRSLIRSLGHSCRGSLLIDDWERMPDLAEWSQFLATEDSPVVWFDRNDAGRQGLARRAFRCHFAENRFADCALRYLAYHGHRSALYIHSSDTDWQSARGKHILSKAGDYGISIRSHQLHSSQVFQDPLRSGVLARLEWIYPQCKEEVKESFDYMVANRKSLAKMFPEFYHESWARSPFDGFCAFAATNPSRVPGIDPALLHHGGRLWAMLALWPYLFDPAITAIICPNDRFATAHHLRYLRDAGLQVPRDVSLLSFDNTFRNSFIPLSTVDPGFGTLGYQAFHAIMNDIPLSFNARRDIAVSPEVIDRGSVGPPRNGGGMPGKSDRPVNTGLCSSSRCP